MSAEKTYLELITNVVRSQAEASMFLFGVKMTWTMFDKRVKDQIEEETGEPAPTTIAGVTVEWRKW